MGTAHGWDYLAAALQISTTLPVRTSFYVYKTDFTRIWFEALMLLCVAVVVYYQVDSRLKSCSAVVSLLAGCGFCPVYLVSSICLSAVQDWVTQAAVDAACTCSVYGAEQGGGKWV